MTPAERLQDLLDGKNQQLVVRLRSGFVVFADNQFLPGYCVFLGYPQVEQLSDLNHTQQAEFLVDMALIGNAVKRVTECARVNYGIYGNKDLFLHAHIVPRYDWEIPEYAVVPPLSYPSEIRYHEDTVWDIEIHGEMQDQIRRTMLAMVEERGHMDHHSHWH
jgi:diadenosine tetraphosphate (Ap4A) HIT family hydrolase